jgi:membrane-associated protease RseP (regulator of RpoE activity)
VLFALTLITTTYWGFLQYQQFYMEDLTELVLNPLAAPRLLLAGLPYGLAVVTFLLAHEMGHYLACRYYGIRATLPYFIPLPPIIPGLGPMLAPGTMGAVIRILSPLKSRKVLFDVAVAGPIAGFVVAVPILVVGMAQSRVVDVDSLGPSITMGEPLIWGPLQAIFAPPVGPDQTLLAHPLAFVGWFALLVTAMNLLPIGQLDGGHLLYTIAPRAHRAVSLAFVLGLVYAGFVYFLGWLLFAAIVLLVLGTRHPRPVVFEQRLGAGRIALLVLALAIFVGCFTLAPISIEF